MIRLFHKLVGTSFWRVVNAFHHPWLALHIQKSNIFVMIHKFRYNHWPTNKNTVQHAALRVCVLCNILNSKAAPFVGGVVFARLCKVICAGCFWCHTDADETAMRKQNQRIFLSNLSTCVVWIEVAIIRSRGSKLLLCRTETETFGTLEHWWVSGHVCFVLFSEKL